MGLPEYLVDLRERHRKLDALIQQEMRRPRPDEELVRHLKRQKLSVKDKIAALGREGKPNPAGRERGWLGRKS